MPKAVTAIPDDLLRSKFADRELLSDELWIVPAQLGMLVGRSLVQLEDDRKVGNPPPCMKPWGEKGPVRYRLGTVRDWMFGPAGQEFNNRAEAKALLAQRAVLALGFATFQDWLDEAAPADKWPFLVRKHGAPVDFFKSLTLGEALSDEDECAWLSLEDYLTMRGKVAWSKEAQKGADGLDAVMAPGTGERRPQVV